MSRRWPYIRFGLAIVTLPWFLARDLLFPPGRFNR